MVYVAALLSSAFLIWGRDCASVSSSSLAEIDVIWKQSGLCVDPTPFALPYILLLRLKFSSRTTHGNLNMTDYHTQQRLTLCMMIYIQISISLKCDFPSKLYVCIISLSLWVIRYVLYIIYCFAIEFCSATRSSCK